MARNSLEIPQTPGSPKSTLLHADLHERNIFVSDDDPTIITGLIDCQSSSIEPDFVYADEMPDFAAPIH
jgi:aminoglycoside phosphotransferase (APT) family kinase protein